MSFPSTACLASPSADLRRTAWKNFNSSVSMSCVSNLTMAYFYHLLDLVVRGHCLLTINWMFCTNTACCADDLIVFTSSPSSLRGRIFVLLGRLHHLLTRSITTLANTVVRYVHVRLGGSLWILACYWECSSSACCWHCSFFMGSWVPSLADFLCPSRPSVPCSFAHLTRHRLRSGCCFVIPARAAHFFLCLFPG